MSRVTTILTTTSGSATGPTFTPEKNNSPGTTRNGPLKFQASIVGTGTVTCTVVIEVTNTPAVAASWITMGTITLTGTTTATDGFATTADWPANRARTTAISGTGTALTVTMAV